MVRDRQSQIADILGIREMSANDIASEIKEDRSVVAGALRRMLKSGKVEKRATTTKVRCGGFNVNREHKTKKVVWRLIDSRRQHDKECQDHRLPYGCTNTESIGASDRKANS